MFIPYLGIIINIVVVTLKMGPISETQSTHSSFGRLLRPGVHLRLSASSKHDPYELCQSQTLPALPQKVVAHRHQFRRGQAHHRVGGHI